MQIAGPVFALDLASVCGLAVGRPGDVPRSGSVTLKRRGEPRSVALGNLVEWLRQEWTAARPALIVKEAPLPLQAFADRGNSEDTVVLTYGLHSIVEAMAQRFGIPCEQGHASTIRKHFLGVGRLGSRDETKRAVVQRCHVLGLMPREVSDDNRADALATWDWGCATFARRSPSMERLHLFGERPTESSVSPAICRLHAEDHKGSAGASCKRGGAVAVNPKPEGRESEGNGQGALCAVVPHDPGPISEAGTSTARTRETDEHLAIPRFLRRGANNEVAG
jgi:hypothetical protein